MSIADARDYVEVNVLEFEVRTRRMPVAIAGAYMLLLQTLWFLGEGRLPFDHAQLARIARCSEQEWPKAWKRLAKHFKISDDGLWITEKRSLLRGTR